MVGRRRNQRDPRNGVACLGNHIVHFESRKLSAFTRFGSLSYFNLYFISINQIFGGDTKASGSYLLMALRMEVPSGSGWKREASSPPSPVLLRPWMVFMAIAIASWASLLIEPKDMAPVTKRRRIFSIGSTRSIEIGLRRKLRKSRRKIGLSLSSAK